MSVVKNIYNTLYYSWYYVIPLVAVMGTSSVIPLTIGYMIYNNRKERNRSISVINARSEKAYNDFLSRKHD